MGGVNAKSTSRRRDLEPVLDLQEFTKWRRSRSSDFLPKQEGTATSYLGTTNRAVHFPAFMQQIRSSGVTQKNEVIIVSGGSQNVANQLVAPIRVGSAR